MESTWVGKYTNKYKVSWSYRNIRWRHSWNTIWYDTCLIILDTKNTSRRDVSWSTWMCYMFSFVVTFSYIHHKAVFCQSYKIFFNPWNIVCNVSNKKIQLLMFTAVRAFPKWTSMYNIPNGLASCTQSPTKLIKPGHSAYPLSEHWWCLGQLSDRLWPTSAF